ncbi:hypothetical protein ACWEQJ_12515, partial [Streptomyces cyaneofuscatus]
ATGSPSTPELRRPPASPATGTTASPWRSPSWVLKETYGGYYTMGRAFVKLIGNPKVMKVATQRGLTHPLLMKFTLKMLANLTDPQGGDAMDRIINGLSKVAPKA